MSALTDYADATNLDLVHRTQMLMTATALAIMSEAANTPGHADRVAYAGAALNAPEPYARLLAFGVVSQGVTAASNDQAISNALAAIWNGYAGYYLT